jgi:hypothetical protein
LLLTAADALERQAQEIAQLRDEREKATAALREAFGEELWNLGHPAYVVAHLREEYAKAERLWKSGSVEVDRLRCLGNAVVPQVVEEIGRAIMRCEGE